VRPVEAIADGHVGRLDAIAVGQAAVRLGAGRRTKADSIDHAVGIVCHVKRGDGVRAGDVLAEVHARDDESAAAAAAELLSAYELGDGAPDARPIVLETIA
nr:pyrimidine-nucleoside phosphorylase [Actinomycetota bacterium]